MRFSLKRAKKPASEQHLFFGRPISGTQLEAMLRPEHDPTKQWDGSPAMTEPPRIVVRSRRQPDSD